LLDRDDVLLDRYDADAFIRDCGPLRDVVSANRVDVSSLPANADGLHSDRRLLLADVSALRATRRATGDVAVRSNGATQYFGTSLRESR